MSGLGSCQGCWRKRASGEARPRAGTSPFPPHTHLEALSARSTWETLSSTHTKPPSSAHCANGCSRRLGGLPCACAGTSSPAQEGQSSSPGSCHPSLTGKGMSVLSLTPTPLSSPLLSPTSTYGCTPSPRCRPVPAQTVALWEEETIGSDVINPPSALGRVQNLTTRKLISGVCVNLCL